MHLELNEKMRIINLHKRVIKRKLLVIFIKLTKLQLEELLINIKLMRDALKGKTELVIKLNMTLILLKNF